MVFGEVTVGGKTFEAGSVVPAQVRGDHATLARVADRGQTFGGPSFERCETPVASGENVVDDEQLSKVLPAVRLGQSIDALVAERHSPGDNRTDTLNGCSAAEPRQTASWEFHAGKRVDERNQGWLDASGAVVEEPLESTPQ